MHVQRVASHHWPKSSYPRKHLKGQIAQASNNVSSFHVSDFKIDLTGGGWHRWHSSWPVYSQNRESHRITASYCWFQWRFAAKLSNNWVEKRRGRKTSWPKSLYKYQKPPSIDVSWHSQAPGHPTHASWHAALASSLVSCHGSSLGQCTRCHLRLCSNPVFRQVAVGGGVAVQSFLASKKNWQTNSPAIQPHYRSPFPSTPSFRRSSGPTGLSSATVRLRPCHRPCCRCPCRRPCRRPSWSCPKASPASGNQSKAHQLKQLSVEAQNNHPQWPIRILYPIHLSDPIIPSPSRWRAKEASPKDRRKTSTPAASTARLLPTRDATPWSWLVSSPDPR